MPGGEFWFVLGFIVYRNSPVDERAHNVRPYTGASLSKEELIPPIIL